MKQHVERVAGSGEITAYTLDNENGLRITALDFGATLASVRHRVGGKEDELLLGLAMLRSTSGLGHSSAQRLGVLPIGSKTV